MSRTKERIDRLFLEKAGGPAAHSSSPHEAAEIQIGRDLLSLIPQLEGRAGPEECEDGIEVLRQIAEELLQLHGIYGPAYHSPKGKQ